MSVPPGKTELRVDASIDHGHDELRQYMTNPGSHSVSDTAFSLAQFGNTIITGKYATIVNEYTGIYWVFSLENASLKKTGNIFNLVTPEMMAKVQILPWHAILCVMPEKDGTILIAAQDERLFTVESLNFWDDKLFDELFNDSIVDLDPVLFTKEFIENREKQMWEYQQRREKDIMDKSPYIVWYRIHPESGKVEKLGNAPEGGSLSRDGGKNDAFMPMPDGSVKMGTYVDKVFQLREQSPEKDKNNNSSNKSKGGADQTAATTVKVQ